MLKTDLVGAEGEAPPPVDTWPLRTSGGPSIEEDLTTEEVIADHISSSAGGYTALSAAAVEASIQRKRKIKRPQNTRSVAADQR